jgi:hypothetical protein
MNKFALEKTVDGNWVLLKDFSTLSGAVRYAKNRLKEVEYRILDRTDGSVMRYSDGDPRIPEIESEMMMDLRQEMERFANTDRWRRRFQERRDNERRDEARRERLARFNFVGTRPIVPQSNRHNDVEDWIHLSGTQPQREKVDWMKEGF